MAAEREPRLGDLIVVHQVDGTTVPALIVEVVSPTCVRLAYIEQGHIHLCPVTHERGERPGDWLPWERSGK